MKWSPWPFKFDNGMQRSFSALMTWLSKAPSFLLLKSSSLIYIKIRREKKMIMTSSLSLSLPLPSSAYDGGLLTFREGRLLRNNMALPSKNPIQRLHFLFFSPPHFVNLLPSFCSVLPKPSVCWTDLFQTDHNILLPPEIRGCILSPILLFFSSS